MPLRRSLIGQFEINCLRRGTFHLFESARGFFRPKGNLRFFEGCSWQQRQFCRKSTTFWGVKYPSVCIFRSSFPNFPWQFVMTRVRRRYYKQLFYRAVRRAVWRCLIQDVCCSWLVTRKRVLVFWLKQNSCIASGGKNDRQLKNESFVELIAITGDNPFALGTKFDSPYLRKLPFQSASRAFQHQF